MLIYKATNKLNNKCYIGQTTQKFKTRKHQHLNSQKTPFHKILKKEGKNNFKWEILCECNSIKELNKMEIHYMKFFNSIWPNGYNMIEGGTTHKDTKKILSNLLKGNNNGKKKYLIITPQKKHFIVENLKEYCRNNVNLDYCKMTYVANGRRLHHKGYICKKMNNITNIKKTIEKLKKVKFGRNTSGYILTSPDGKKFEVNDLKNFCKKYSNINRYGFIRRLNSNSNKDYKGWSIKRIGDLK